MRSLEIPILKPLNEKSNGTLTLTGSAYPKAKILVFINDQYIDDTVVDESGSFSKIVTFNNEGVKKIKTKQTFNGISSDFSREYSVTVDISPPNGKLFKLSKLPEITKAKSILIKGVGSPNDYLVFNGNKYQISKSGTFEMNYDLKEGPNNLEFAMEDELGNKTDILDKRTILVDTIPPEISNSSYFDVSGDGLTREAVNIKIGSWPDIYSVPISGNIKGNIKRITLDGKEITWDENKQIFQRIYLPIQIGLNRFKIVAEDLAGNVSTGYIETSAERRKDTIDINVIN